MRKLAVLLACVTCSIFCSYAFKSDANLETITKINSKLDSVGCKWHFKINVDQFNEPTGEIVIQQEIKGTFSNSVVSNSDFCGTIDYYSETKAVVVLYDYCNKEFKPTILDTNKSGLLDGECRPKDGDKKFQTTYFSFPAIKMDNILLDTKESEFKIILEKYSTNSSYKFTIDKTQAAYLLRMMKYLRQIK